MKLDMFIVDAFAQQVMTGNPAAVCPLPEWIDAGTMQRIAAEMNLSETVFFVPRNGGYEIRWFTPTREVDLIGHATLAAGMIVLTRIDTSAEEATFCTRTHQLTVRPEADRFSLRMPALVPCPAEEYRAALQGALQAPVVESHAAMHHLAVLESPDAVARLRPDMSALARLDLPAVIATAPGGPGVDFVSRFFAPANGVPEDPVSGVAHCCLAPFWAKRLRRDSLAGKQLSPRGGLVECRVEGDSVVLVGGAVLFLAGFVTV